jgi:deoxyribodipyrimidine photo-lyase
MTHTNIWWIRRDIRLHDNPTLDAALVNADYFIPLFIIEPELMDNAAPKRRAFLLNALADLDRELRKLGSHLILRQGPAYRVFKSLTESFEAVSIYAHEDFSPFARERDQAIAEQFDLILKNSTVLRHPTEILKNDNNPYTVYTPYKNKWYRKPLPTPADCLTATEHLPPLPKDLPSDPLPAVQSIAGFPATANKAQNRLTAFTTGAIQHYNNRRDRLDLNGTSRLSPYLRFGLISARETFTQSQIALLKAGDDQTRAEIRAWMDELVWREFYTAILYHFPR